MPGMSGRRRRCRGLQDRGELPAHRGRPVGHDGVDDLVLARRYWPQTSRQVRQRPVAPVGEDLLHDRVAAVRSFGLGQLERRIGEDRVMAPGGNSSSCPDFRAGVNGDREPGAGQVPATRRALRIQVRELSEGGDLGGFPRDYGLDLADSGSIHTETAELRKRNIHNEHPSPAPRTSPPSRAGARPQAAGGRRLRPRKHVRDEYVSDSGYGGRGSRA